jgi:hypothetical protein
VTHVEFLPNVMVFCGLRVADIPPTDAVLLARDWFGAVERLQIADCPGCLLKLHMIGDSVQIKITRMGMKVEVHDVDETALREN